MFLFKLLVFTLTFYELIVDLDARTTCPKGQRVTKGRCESCPSETFQPEDNDYQICKACTKCDVESGSVVEKKCTKKTNTKCQCRGEFVPRESDSSTCKCDVGFGLNRDRCSKCEDGYFSSQINSGCQKWRECKCGVKKPGTRTTDVTCNVESQGCSDASHSYIPTPSNTYITNATTSNNMVSLITRLTSHHSHERAHTQKMHTIATTIAAAAGHTDANIVTGVTFLILGIIGLLLLTAVICKLHITPQPIARKNDSLCRRPVEESGESSLSSLKLNPGEH
ncbi:tumor necrosis factor receptor superfamily member 21 [Clinocottus analis]|uniref:tumor necrosis factor receptor superfamily member 21 n=1 Tax=Clinocottus analis TaxID=304258 RepID=UPI0035C12D06